MTEEYKWVQHWPILWICRIFEYHYRYDSIESSCRCLSYPKKFERCV